MQNKSQKEGTEYVNDLTFEIECLKATVAKVNELKPDMVVFTGDQGHLPYDKEQWDAFVLGISDIDPSIEQYHLPGNHDHILKDGTADPQDFIARFGSDRFAVKKGNVYQAFIELYKIKMFLKDPNLRLKLVLVDMEEYRLLNGWSSDRKKGSTRYDRIPTDLVSEVELERVEDYMQFVPAQLEGKFTVKDFAKAAHIPDKLAQTVLNILHHMETVDRVGKQGNAYVYSVAEGRL